MARDITSEGFLTWFDAEQRKPTDAVPTPLNTINRNCHGDGAREGFARGWFITVGGNPGHGKSILAMNFAAHAMQMNGEFVGYVSLEMTAREIAQRMYAIITKRQIRNFERDGYEPQALQGIRQLPYFFVPDKVAQNWEAVINEFETMYDEGCRYFVLDYLQLVQAGNEHSIYEAVASVVTYLRGWALNNGSVLVVLSQYNRETSKNYFDSPVSQSLWGGMMLEASSDIVLLLDHSRYSKEGHLARTWLIMDKNRHGSRGEIPIEWDYRTVSVREATEREVELWPTQKRRAS